MLNLSLIYYHLSMGATFPTYRFKFTIILRIITYANTIMEEARETWMNFYKAQTNIEGFRHESELLKKR